MSIQEMIGKILGSWVDTRDALHVAVVAVTADEDLRAGDRIGMKRNGRAGKLPDEVIGIVDPFLTESVDKGERFWMFMLPGTTENLRHSWSCPQLPDDILNNDGSGEDSCAGCY